MDTLTLGDLRDAIKATLGVAIPELTVYDTVPDQVNLPCVIVMPVTATFGFTKADPDDDWSIDLHVLTSLGDVGIAQDNLDPYVSSGGPQSLRAAIARFWNLGVDGANKSVRARITGMSGYGAQSQVAGIEYVGATLRLLVTIRGPR
jgi:hypothetical protein